MGSSGLLTEQLILVAMTFVTVSVVDSAVDSNESLFQTEPGSSDSLWQLVFEVSHLASHLLRAMLRSWTLLRIAFTVSKSLKERPLYFTITTRYEAKSFQLR